MKCLKNQVLERPGGALPGHWLQPGGGAALRPQEEGLLWVLTGGRPPGRGLAARRGVPQLGGAATMS